MTAPPAGLDGQGWREGLVAEDLRLVDQFGDPVSLWQFSGRVIAVDVVEKWIADCRDLGPETEAIWQDYRDEGFVYLTVLRDTQEGVQQVDLDNWTWDFGITAPVLRDPMAQTLGMSPSACSVTVIDRDLVVREQPNHEAERVREAIEALL